MTGESRNRRAIEIALEALRRERREYEPGETRYEVVYGDWDMEAYAANRYAEIADAIERLEKMLENGGKR